MRVRFVRWVGGVVLTVAAVVGAAGTAATARAGEPTSEGAAKAAVEALRDDVHRAKVRIDWPEMADVEPPDGAEITLIGGTIEYAVTRIVRRGDRVDGRTVGMGRNWFYGADERFTDAAFDVAPADFRRVWNAVRRVDGATPVRTTESSGTIGGSVTLGSHTPSHWVRLREEATGSPLHVSVATRTWTRDADRILEWDEIRDESAFRLAAALLPKEGRRPADFVDWAPWLTEEILRTAPTLSVAHRHPDPLLMEVCLRGAGEVGGEDALAAVDTLEAKLRAAPDTSDYAVTSLLDECWGARTKLKLRHAFDPSFAADLLRTTDRGVGWRIDLVRWVRRRWRDADLKTFGEFIRSEARRPGVSAERLGELLEDLSTLPGDDTVRIARQLLDWNDVGVVAGAAAVLLARDRHDEAALAALSEPFGDAWRPPSRLFETPDALRKALADGKEDGRWVRVAIDVLRQARQPLVAEESLRAWRAVLALPEHRGTMLAVRALLERRDRASLDRIGTLLARWETDAAARESLGLAVEELGDPRYRYDALRESGTGAEPDPK